MSFSKWPVVLLGEVADLTVGFVSTMADSYVETGVPFLRSLNIQRFHISFDDMKYITTEMSQRLKKSLLQPGDVVIVRTGKPGTCAVIPGSLANINCSDLVIVRPDNDKLDPNFLAAYVNMIAFGHINANIVGAVQQHFNIASAKKIPILLPPIEIQKHIACYINMINDKIEINNRINANLEAQAQAIFNSWFVYFEPFQDSEFEDSELGPIPKGWRVDTISNFSTEMKSGGTPSRSVSQYWNSKDVPWIKTGEINDMPIIQCSEYISYLGLEKSSAKMLPRNAVLIALYGATAGKIALLRFEAATNQACCAMICNTPNSAIFLFEYLRMMQEYIKGLSIGSAQQNLSKETIASLKIVIPPDYILQSMPFEIIYNINENYMIQNRILATLRDTLLPKLMTGEIEVPII